jgi:hypothetical protein
MNDKVNEVMQLWKAELQDEEKQLNENLEKIKINLEVKRSKLWIVQMALEDIRNEEQKQRFYELHGHHLEKEIEQDEKILNSLVQQTREKVHHIKLLIQNIDRELQSQNLA